VYAKIHWSITFCDGQSCDSSKANAVLVNYPSISFQQILRETRHLNENVSILLEEAVCVEPGEEDILDDVLCVCGSHARSADGTDLYTNTLEA
jgi:hypothetical protein